MNEETDWLAPLLQAADSAFPTGSYAHSYGFEEIVRLGLVRDAASMARHLEEHVWPALIHFELPVVRLARVAALGGDLPALLELDHLVEASKGTRELREASRNVGRRRLHAMIDLGASTFLVQFAKQVREEQSPGHHAIVFGAACSSLPEEAQLTAWAFQAINSVCLCAPKLLRIGQDAVQRVLRTALAGMTEKIAASHAIARDDLGWFDPTLELASMQHEIAHERLFIS